MSTLTLTVLRCPEPAATQRRRTQGGSLTLGRADDCDWPLPDPLRSLSRKHCTIEFYGGVWQLRDLSANGTRINAEPEPVGHGLARQLRDGDRLLLGDYEIEVRIEDVMSTLSGPVPGSFGSPFGSDAAVTSVFGQGAAPRTSFGGARLPGLDDPPPYKPFGGSPLDSGVQADHAPASAGAYLPPPVSAPPAKAIPDNWFDLEESQIRLRTPVPPPAPATFEPVAPAPVSPPAPAWPPSPSWDAPPAPAAPAWDAPAPTWPPPAAQPAPTPDWPEPVPATAPPAPAALAAAAPLTSAPPPFVQPPVHPVHQLPAGTVPPGGDAMATAFAVLLQGSDLPADLVVRAAANPEQALRAAGALLRVAVGGMRSLLIARGSVKREFRIEQTMIRTRENNPLKFATSDEQALAALLDPRTAALDAVNESITDLTGHQVAVMAATQAAARALLSELEPERLLAEDPGGGFLPGAQEKRLWEAYKRRHAKLIEQFEDDLKSAFGTAFARAYEDAVGRSKG